MSFLPPGSRELFTEWHGLRESIAPLIGERALTLFSFTIANEDQCPATESYFRAALVAVGDDPEHPQVTETEQLLIDWGRQIVTSPNAISLEFSERIEHAFRPECRLAILRFAGQLIAANRLFSAGKMPLTDQLAAPA